MDCNQAEAYLIEHADQADLDDRRHTVAMLHTLPGSSVYECPCTWTYRCAGEHVPRTWCV